MFKKHSLYVTLFFALLSPYLLAGEYAVTPMMIEMASTPKKTEQFSFQVFGKSAGSVNISAWDMAQQVSGHMGFILPEKSQKSLASWVTIDNPNFSIKKDQQINVTGTITVPPWANGSYHTALMVEEAQGRDVKGVVVNVRYAVILNITVEGKRTRIKSTFRNLRLVEQDNKLYITGRFKNLSNRDYRLSSKTQLRDSNNRLISQINLKTQSAWQRSDELSRVFPGAEVELFGLIEKAVNVGRYQAIVRNNFGDRHQPTFRSEMVITDAIYAATAPKAHQKSVLQLLPEQIKLKVRRNGHTSSTMVLVNHHPYAVDVTFPSDSSTSQTLLKKYRFTPATLRLEPNERRMVMLKQTFKKHDTIQAVNHRAEILINDQVEWLDIRATL